MDSTTSIIWGILFGAIGMGYLIYGRKQRRSLALLSGIVLCAFPYFVSNVFLMILIGIIAMVLPFFVRYCPDEPQPFYGLEREPGENI